MLMRHRSVNKDSPTQAGLFIVHVRIGPEENTVLNKLYKLLKLLLFYKKMGWTLN